MCCFLTEGFPSFVREEGYEVELTFYYYVKWWRYLFVSLDLLTFREFLLVNHHIVKYYRVPKILIKSDTDSFSLLMYVSLCFRRRSQSSLSEGWLTVFEVIEDSIVEELVSLYHVTFVLCSLLFCIRLTDLISCFMMTSVSISYYLFSSIKEC